MALPVELTLDEARQEVLLGIGVSNKPSEVPNLLPQIDFRIRQAQTLIYNDADWVPLDLSVQIPITEGQDVYDWPDDAAPGKVDRVIAARTDTDPIRVHTLTPGIIPEMRNFVSSNGNPTHYTYQDRVIKIFPIPDEKWGFLQLDYIQRLEPLVNANDRLSIDSTAVVLKAIILQKVQQRQSGVPELAADLIKYIKQLQRNNGTKEPFDMRLRRPVVSAGRLGIGRNAAYTENWVPWIH